MVPAQPLFIRCNVLLMLVLIDYAAVFVHLACSSAQLIAFVAAGKQGRCANACLILLWLKPCFFQKRTSASAVSLRIAGLRVSCFHLEAKQLAKLRISLVVGWSLSMNGCMAFLFCGCTACSGLTANSFAVAPGIMRTSSQSMSAGVLHCVLKVPLP